MKDIVRVGTAVVIAKIDKNGNAKILLGERCGELRPGVFALPGGKPDKWEQPEHAAIREIKEETDIQIASARKFTWINNPMQEHDMHYITLVFIATEFTGEPKNMELTKCKGWKWYGKDELPYPLWPGLGPVLQEAFRII